MLPWPLLWNEFTDELKALLMQRIYTHREDHSVRVTPAGVLTDVLSWATTAVFVIRNEFFHGSAPGRRRDGAFSW